MEISALIQQLRTEIAAKTRDLAELERIAQQYAPKSDALVVSIPRASPYVGPQVEPHRPGGDFSLIGSAIKVIESYPIGMHFTKNDIVAAIQAMHPTTDVNAASVSAQLLRLAQKGRKIDLFEQGAGNKPSVYIRKDPTDRISELEEDLSDQTQNGKERHAPTG